MLLVGEEEEEEDARLRPAEVNVSVKLRASTRVPGTLTLVLGLELHDMGSSKVKRSLVVRKVVVVGGKEVETMLRRVLLSFIYG